MWAPFSPPHSLIEQKLVGEVSGAFGHPFACRMLEVVKVHWVVIVEQKGPWVGQ